jgi:hypothetical protein
MKAHPRHLMSPDATPTNTDMIVHAANVAMGQLRRFAPQKASLQLLTPPPARAHKLDPKLGE